MSQHHKVIGFHLLHKTKTLASSDLDKQNSGLVAQGFLQTHGLDYIKKFSQFFKFTTIHLIPSILIYFGWNVRQLDINNVFSMATWRNLFTLSNHLVLLIQYVLIMSCLDYVCNINKSLYGLK